MKTTCPRDLLKVSDFQPSLPISKKTVYDWSRAGLFPEPVALGGPRGLRWRRQDVDAWLVAHGLSPLPKN